MNIELNAFMRKFYTQVRDQYGHFQIPDVIVKSMLNGKTDPDMVKLLAFKILKDRDLKILSLD